MPADTNRELPAGDNTIGSVGLTDQVIAGATLVTPGNSTTGAGADNSITFSHQVTRYFLQNNSGAAVYVNEDNAATQGSVAVAAGGYVDSDMIPVTVLHVYTAGALSVNGTTAGGLVVRGTY